MNKSVRASVFNHGGVRKGAGRPRKPYKEKLGAIRRDAERRKRNRELLQDLQSDKEHAAKKNKTLQKALLDKQQEIVKLQQQLFLRNNAHEFEKANQVDDDGDDRTRTFNEQLESDMATKSLGTLIQKYKQHRVTPARSVRPPNRFKISN